MSLPHGAYFLLRSINLSLRGRARLLIVGVAVFALAGWASEHSRIFASTTLGVLAAHVLVRL